MSALEPPTKKAKSESEWNIVPSAKASRTRNPIRAIVDSIAKQKLETDKDMIPLSLGDPTVFGNLKAPDVLVESIVSNTRSFKHNGYCHSAGIPAAREAVAEYFGRPDAPLTADDVILASGGSGALDIAITATLNEGDNLLVPAPGFPLYQVIAESNGASVKQYPLVPERDWEVDCEVLESLIDDRTRAILVNNPSNPCGSLFSDQNLKDILAVAEKHKLLIISDEIYGTMTFTGYEFTPIAALTTTVPVLAVGGMAKMFCVPGWRVGWIMINDRNNVLTHGGMRQGLMNLSQLILGANALVQSAIPSVLVKPIADSIDSNGFSESNGHSNGASASTKGLPPAAAAAAAAAAGGGGSGGGRGGGSDAEQMEAFRQHYVGYLEQASKFTTDKLRKAPGLSVVEPRGAMYVMVQVHPDSFVDLPDDQVFAQRLLKEEAVFVLPGAAFYAPNFFRVVFSGPEGKLNEAYDRIIQFCHRHAKKN